MASARSGAKRRRLSRGRFITFEGGEGGGKTTQARLLADALKARGIAALVTREPGGSPGAEQIRSLLVSGKGDRWDPLAETLLHFAARSEHIAKTIEPALAAGTWVLCDRFADSTMAYQGYAQGLGRDRVDEIRAAALGTFAPDLTFILDLPVALGLRREAKRAGAAAEARYSRMGTAFHRKVRAAFLDIAHHAPKRCVVIDARAGIDAVHSAIWSTIEERLLG